VIVLERQRKEKIVKRNKSLRSSVAIGTALVLILPLLSIASAPTGIQPSSKLLFPLDQVEIGSAARVRPEAVRPRVDQAYGKLPLTFEANRGQTDSQVKFLARGSGSTLFLTSTEAVLVLTRREARANRDKFPLLTRDLTQPGKVTQTVVRMKLVGANAEPQVAELEELPGKVNYFIGNDPAKWHTNVPTYARVEYRDIYPGVNLVYYGNQRQLEYDFVVRPGTDPKTIALGFQGADKLEVDAQGDLVLHTAAGTIRQRRPVIYQEVDGDRREIGGGYVLKSAHQVGFRVAAYDASRPLVIDPVLSYSTYLGGFYQDSGKAIAVDLSGNAYVTGLTASPNFPTTVGAFQPSPNNASFLVTAFVTKLNSTGAVVYSTYFGGAPVGITIDAAGNTYVTGTVGSISNFPTTPGAFNQTPLGSGVFVTKLDPTGSSLVYSAVFGGSDYDEADGIAVDASGSAYIAGRTRSRDFPTTPAAFQIAPGSGRAFHAFVTKLDPTGSNLIYSTYLSGSYYDIAAGIAVDPAGNAYVVGTTSSTDFPTTPGAFQSTFTPGGAVFVTKLNPAGSGLIYSTLLGSSGDNQGRAIAVDTSGNAYVTGYSSYTSIFPTTLGAFKPTFCCITNAFVTKVDPTGTALVYSTFLGGSSSDTGNGIAVDSSGNAWVTGRAQSADFPTTSAAFQAIFGGVADAFVAQVNPTGSGLVYSSYLGGSDEDEGFGIALDPAGNAFVTGSTGLAYLPGVNNFPTTPGAFQPTYGGDIVDAFVAKISPNYTSSGNNVSVSAGNGVTVTFATVSSPGETTATTSSTGPTPPAGFSLGASSYYAITTTATFGPPVTICITYNPVQFSDPTTLRLFHFENSAWVDVTTSNDTVAGIICGQTSSLSPFLLVQRGGPLTSLGPANVWVGLKNSDAVGIRFDLRAEVYRNGTQLVGSGELASVAGGSSGFNNAKQNAIALTPSSGVTFNAGETLSIKLLVRNACTGSGKNSGTARLWYNDNAANSRFDATIGNPATYYLGSALVTAPGAGPKNTIDVAAGAKCSSYKEFDTWSRTLP
jgi:hypothetical protein